MSQGEPVAKAKPRKKRATPSRRASPTKTSGEKKAARGKAVTAATPKPQKPPREPKPKPPRKPRFDPEIQKAIREALTRQRDQLVSVVKSAQAQMAERVIGLSDPSDQASEGYGGELAVGLMAIEAAQLDEIEAAINRIDTGTFGLCLECGKPIPKKRIEVLPFARRCLACEGLREHRVRTQASYIDDDL
ncbi:MAG: TraR/DksA family transcriptional regulator [Planctomycetota bacterium]